ncbi:MAG: PAS domain S-box protein [Salibacteraceae bacterium]
MNEKAKTDTVLTNSNKMGLWGLVAGIVFVLIAWGIDFYMKELTFFPFSFTNVKYIHTEAPIHYLIDLAPLLFGSVAYLVSMQMRMHQRHMEALVKHQSENVSKLALFAEKIGNGDFDAQYQTSDRNDSLGLALLDMREKLLYNKQQDSNKSWIAVGRDQIATLLREQSNVDQLAELVIIQLVDYVKAVQGAIYLTEDDDQGVTWLQMKASYAYNRKKYLNGSFRLGHGLVGEAAIEQNTIHRTEVPESYVSITSGLLGDRKPGAILIVPLVSEEMLQGAIELAGFDAFTDLEIEFVEELATIIARTIYNLKTTERTATLLEESQTMTRELQDQQSLLEQNAVEMQAKQEEIEQSNNRLEEQIMEVRNSQLRQHALLENASEIIAIYDEDARVKYESPSISNILGYDPEELVGQNDFHKADEKGQSRLRKMFADVLDHPTQIPTIQYSYQTKTGDRLWLEASARNLLSDPAINGVVLNSRDITERRKAEQEQIMRGKMQALSENSQDIIMRFNLGGEFLYVNPRINEYTGLRKTLFTGKTYEQMDLNPKIVDAWKSILQKTQETGKLVAQEVDFPSRKGDRVMLTTAIPEFGADENLETVLVVAHDITERKKQEVLIRETNKKITDSINYAQRLQKAIVPDTNYIQKEFPKSFIFYEPRDVVSGDFPYYYEKGDLLYLAAVDCTGHGVPGAMLSLIGFSVLNEILGHDRVYNAGETLDLMHQGVVKTLKQDHEDNVKTADGMDVAIVRVNKKTREVSFSGAHRPLYHITGGELIQYKGDRFPIGGTQYKKRSNFTNHLFTYQEGDGIYFFSDGLPDQFGGPEKMKYGPKRIREKLLEHQDMPMGAMHDLFAQEFKDWKGDVKQLDDVLMIGIRF